MNNNDKTPITAVGPSFATLLTILFITLKLCGIITWSWVWVLSPLWISISLVIGIVIIAATLMTVGKSS